MGLFAKIGEAQISGGGIYFLAGLYKVEVEKVFTLRSRKGDDLFIVECKILESNVAARAVGSKASWVVSLSQDSALGNIKGFCLAASGDPETVIDEAAVEFAVSSVNPLAGTVLDLQCTDILTRAGKPFTLHKWITTATA